MELHLSVQYIIYAFSMNIMKNKGDKSRLCTNFTLKTIAIICALIETYTHKRTWITTKDKTPTNKQLHFLKSVVVVVVVVSSHSSQLLRFCSFSLYLHQIAFYTVDFHTPFPFLLLLSPPIFWFGEKASINYEDKLLQLCVLCKL